MTQCTPTKKGYSMPAEWEIHEATWVSWPHPGCLSFPGTYDRVIPFYARMVESLAESETVRINVLDTAEEARVRSILSPAVDGRIEYHHIPTNEPWCRDHGPIFLKRRESPALAAVDFRFNAWGWKLSPFEEDDVAARAIAQASGAHMFSRNDFILEGGSIDGNGAGTILTTESCLLNANRNPSCSREKIEHTLRDFLGVKKILWLGDGIAGDDTDGHIDDITRFVNESTVVTAVEENSDDPNYEPLQLNLDRLKSMTLHNGTPLRIIKLPMPSKVVRKGQRLPASYANFYIANNRVLMPTYADPNDGWAEAVLKEVFPAREIIPIDCRELIWGLGACHCLTQQQPAVAG